MLGISVPTSSVFSVVFGTHALPQRETYAMGLPIDDLCVTLPKLHSGLLGSPNSGEIISLEDYKVVCGPGKLHNVAWKIT